LINPEKCPASRGIFTTALRQELLVHRMSEVNFDIAPYSNPLAKTVISYKCSTDSRCFRPKIKRPSNKTETEEDKATIR
jgi:hypothetical protein